MSGASCALPITLQQTVKEVVCIFIDKETETQKDQYIPQGQRTIGKENQKASSDWSDPGVV